jgi:uncharacterized protein (DUF58 family)
VPRLSTGSGCRGARGLTRRPSLKLLVYLLITAVGSIAALSTGRPEYVALAAPFAAYVTVGLALAAEPSAVVSAELERERMLEGEELSVTVLVDSPVSGHLLELELCPGRGLVPNGERRRVLRLTAGDQHEAVFALRAERWGGFPAGTVRCRAHDRFGLFDYQLSALPLGPLRVFPRLETLRMLLDPMELQATTGSRVSRGTGDGIEFADIRPFAVGDRVRRINWRATARHGALYVSERHPERNADVILFLDTYAQAGDQTDSTLARAVRAAASLAAAYLAAKDRVGVVGFGGVLYGLGPRLGTAQLYRILDALLGSQVVFSYAQREISFVPRRLLPTKALVIAITPLIDERSIEALFNLRARGFDLAVLEVSPVPFAASPPSASNELAQRLWILQREALKARFERVGVAVSEWRGDGPLQTSLVSATGFRRHARQRVVA